MSGLQWCPHDPHMDTAMCGTNRHTLNASHPIEVSRVNIDVLAEHPSVALQNVTIGGNWVKSTQPSQPHMNLQPP